MVAENAAAPSQTCASAKRYGGAEDVFVVPVIVAPLELGQVEGDPGNHRIGGRAGSAWPA